ncbi:MAG TPA: hypothetical protein VFR01_09255 [Geobacterales bacterium]|jgi:hypothetical protein|nr:hypothetical protein [Geobacterales bacterium]
MKNVKRITVVIAALTFLAVLPTTRCYAESPLAPVVEDGFYGAVIGVLVGGAMIAFTHKPEDHLDYVGYGAAIGTLGGIVFGVADVSRSFAQIDNGKVRFAIPTIIPEIGDKTSHGETPIIITAQLVKGTF